MTVPGRFAAFISYSHIDMRFAARLHADLERFVIPASWGAQALTAGGRPDRVLPVYRDREEMKSAAGLSDVTRAALAESNALIVVCSERATENAWIEAEIREYKRLGKGGRIFAIIAEDAHGIFLPPALRTGDDGQTPREPMVFDARKAQGGLGRALPLLVAALAGVDSRVARRTRSEAPRSPRAGRSLRISGATTIALVTLGVAASSAAFVAYRSMDASAWLELVHGVSDNWIALGAAVVSTISASVAANQRRQEMRIGWNKDLIFWARDAMDALAMAQSLCSAQRDEPDWAARQALVKERLSVAVDHGRLFFENQSGLRPKILDPLVAAKRLVISAPKRSVEDVLASLDIHRTNFWTRVQKAVDPRWVRGTVQGPDTEPGDGAYDYAQPLLDER